MQELLKTNVHSNHRTAHSSSTCCLHMQITNVLNLIAILFYEARRWLSLLHCRRLVYISVAVRQRSNHNPPNIDTLSDSVTGLLAAMQVSGWVAFDAHGRANLQLVPVAAANAHPPRAPPASATHVPPEAALVLQKISGGEILISHDKLTLTAKQIQSQIHAIQRSFHFDTGSNGGWSPLAESRFWEWITKPKRARVAVVALPAPTLALADGVMDLGQGLPAPTALAPAADVAAVAVPAVATPTVADPSALVVESTTQAADGSSGSRSASSSSDSSESDSDEGASEEDNESEDCRKWSMKKLVEMQAVLLSENISHPQHQFMLDIVLALGKKLGSD